jgi:putative oxidoreductase
MLSASHGPSMTTHVPNIAAGPGVAAEVAIPSRARGLRYAVPVGRVLFAAVFVLSSVGHFSPATIGYAAAHGVPFAGVLVPLSGIVALVGGTSVMLGFKARYGAALIVLFLLPVTLIMHRFWGLEDAQAAMLQRIMFMKNASMLGAALLLVYFGAGPLSIDARLRRRSPSR